VLEQNLRYASAMDGVQSNAAKAPSANLHAVLNIVRQAI
jgi:hypothetical protein